MRTYFAAVSHKPQRNRRAILSWSVEIMLARKCKNKEGSVIWGEFFMFYNICFSQLTDQMNDYMATFQLTTNFESWFWQRVTNKACPYSACSTIWTYMSLLLRKPYNWTSSEDKWTSSEENWAPSLEDNSTLLCDYRSSSENNWPLILVN
mgnify:CR=1 FL=1